MPKDNPFEDFGSRPPQPPRGNRSSSKPKFDLPDFDRSKLIKVVMAAFAALFVFIVFLTGRGGIVEVKDNEVAVIVNYLSGKSTVITTPGYKVFMPFANQAFKFDRTPNEFLMEGESRGVRPSESTTIVRKLTARANDGSNFWFEKLEIHYKLLEDQADVVLSDSGEGDAFKENWVRAYARSVLRDEFGRFSAEQVADPTNYDTATQTSRVRLNELLNPHGIEITQILTPKPQFEPKYEKAIEDRKIADQEVERLKEEFDRLDRDREKRLANIERDKNTLFEELKGELEGERIATERDKVKVEKEADAFKIAEVASGLAVEERQKQEALALEEQARKEAEGLRARVDALAKRGDILVREELARKLAQITFTIVPYRRDPTPTRLEHSNATSVENASAGVLGEGN